MNLAGNTLLITGGASGIGYALATRFVKSGSKVIVCGRRKEQLAQAGKNCPGLHTIQCDLATEADRIALVEKVIREFPDLNILVNNAGIQNRLPPLNEPQTWEKHAQEIAINLQAPMHLSMLFISHLLKRKSPAIVNITSGLAFAPLSFMPTYCATKAALHSFTITLRHQLSATPIKVYEVIPPAVNTDLGGKGLHTEGAPLDPFADHVMALLAKDEFEFGYGMSEKSRLASREQLNASFAAMNKR